MDVPTASRRSARRASAVSWGYSGKGNGRLQPRVQFPHRSDGLRVRPTVLLAHVFLAQVATYSTARRYGLQLTPTAPSRGGREGGRGVDGFCPPGEKRGMLRVESREVSEDGRAVRPGPGSLLCRLPERGDAPEPGAGRSRGPRRRGARPLARTRRSLLSGSGRRRRLPAASRRRRGPVGAPARREPEARRSTQQTVAAEEPGEALCLGQRGTGADIPVGGVRTAVPAPVCLSLLRASSVNGPAEANPSFVVYASADRREQIRHGGSSGTSSGASRDPCLPRQVSSTRWHERGSCRSAGIRGS